MYIHSFTCINHFVLFHSSLRHRLLIHWFSQCTLRFLLCVETVHIYVYTHSVGISHSCSFSFCFLLEVFHVKSNRLNLTGCDLVVCSPLLARISVWPGLGFLPVLVRLVALFVERRKGFLVPPGLASLF